MANAIIAHPSSFPRNPKTAALVLGQNSARNSRRTLGKINTQTKLRRRQNARLPHVRVQLRLNPARLRASAKIVKLNWQWAKKRPLRRYERAPVEKSRPSAKKAGPAVGGGRFNSRPTDKTRPSRSGPGNTGPKGPRSAPSRPSRPGAAAKGGKYQSRSSRY